MSVERRSLPTLAVWAARVSPPVPPSPAGSTPQAAPVSPAFAVSPAATASPVGPQACDASGHCITCSDEGVAMRVVTASPDGLAVCEGADGSRSEVLVGLVEDVVPGDTLLVHAGTALARLGGGEADAGRGEDVRRSEREAGA